jgi:hypothetical protein
MNTTSASTSTSYSSYSILFFACISLKPCEPDPNEPERESTSSGPTSATTEEPDEPTFDDDGGVTTWEVVEIRRDMGREPDDPNEQLPAPDADGCHGIYAQDLLPEFELTIDLAVWQSLVWEWNNGQLQEDLGVDPDPYHDLDEFKYEGIVIKDAMIRLRGNPTYWNIDDKLQFQISFDEYDDNGRFLGLRKLAFDAATYNRHMLRDRLALQAMRDMGVPAPCANNARLVINGEYYGIFTNIEKVDEVYLERVFEDPSGDLWKRANWDLQTNKKTATKDRLNALKGADTVQELESYLDVAQALEAFASEAIIPDSDGMWAGGLNFYCYDNPLNGRFQMIPWDLDNTFEYFNDPPDGEYPTNPDPIVWEKPTTHGRPFYTLAMSDEGWFQFYIEAIEEQVEVGYQPQVLHDRINTWTAQIQQSVFDDVNKPYTNQLYLKKVQELHNYVDVRHAFLMDWLDCWNDGGEPDAKGYCELP